jgi:protein ImuA
VPVSPPDGGVPSLRRPRTSDPAPAGATEPWRQATARFAAEPNPARLATPVAQPAPTADPTRLQECLLGEAETLHPAVWRAHQLGRTVNSALPSGFAELDTELPGGGWPRRVLIELLLLQSGIGEIRLLATTLVALMHEGRSVMLFDPPALPCASALQALGLALPQLVVVRGRGRLPQLLPNADTLWAIEQALKSGHVGAVLAWLAPRLRADALRRLQLAAQAHDGPAFLFREAQAQARPSAAPLRLLLRPAGADRLSLRIVKRRGPVLDRPLLLSLPPVLPAVVHERLRHQQQQPSPPPAVEATSTVRKPLQHA